MPINASKVYQARQEQANEMERQGRYSEAKHLRETADYIQEVNTLIISIPIIEIEEVVLTVRTAQSTGFFTRMWTAVRGLFSSGKNSSEIAETVAGKVPNPYGKTGGPLHQSTVKEAEEKLVKDGFTEIDREVMVRTPNGTKSKRFVDIQGTNPKTKEIKQIQVGKQTQKGNPISRERKALDDIEAATGTRPEFMPYNKTNTIVPGSAGKILP